jgi:uncharacterized protein YidB (DUF937 family)
MGILDVLRGALGGAPNQPGGNPLVAGVLQLLNDPRTGGLQGLVQSFHDKGLGGIAASWVGTGANQPISPDQVTHALGAERVQELARSAGAQQGAVASQLATLLPTIIDQLTPHGTIPEGGALAQGLAALRSTLGASATPTNTTKPS